MSEPANSESLGARTVKGAGWLMGWRLVSRMLGIANTVVLVRLLTPADFGLVALATSFSLAIDSMSYLGVSDALVREHSVDRTLYDTGFTITVLRGLMTSLIIAACAWPAARLFGDSRLTVIFLVLAAGLLSTSFENIGIVDFQRDLAFGKQFQIMLVPRIGGIIASITCAVVWHSYWALVAGLVVSRAMRLFFTYAVHPFRPRITLQAWRRLISFSFWSWAISMTALIHSRSDTIIIGGFLNPTAVGVFSIGGEVGSLASSELVEPISRALFAGFSSARRTGDGVASAYIRAISLVVLITLPTSAGVALLAGPLMHLVFGPQWDAAIPLVKVFALVGMLRVGGAVSGVLLTVEGMVKYGFHIELTSAILRVIVLLSLVPTFGLMGAVYGLAATGLIEEVIYLIITFRHTRLRPRDLALGLWRPSLATAVMAIVLLGAGLDQPLPDVAAMWRTLHLAGTALLGALVYSTTLLVAWLAAGRPRGAETYFLGLAGQILRHRLGR